MNMAGIENDVQIATHSDENCVWEKIYDFTTDGSSINSSHVAAKYENEQERNLLPSYEFTSGNKRFFCYFCGKSFNFHHQLVHHKKYHKKHHKKLGKMNCQNCGKDFKFKFVFNRHMLSCHRSNQTDKSISINNKSIVQTVPYNESISESVTSGNCCVIGGKEKICSIENVTEINDLECLYQTGAANSAESTIQAMSHNQMMNNYDLNMKNKKNIFTTANEKNRSDLTDASYLNNLAEQTASHTNVINELNVKEEPEDNYFARETEYFIIRKFPEYTCKICKKILSADIHFFATHMISHKECNMHECIVCDIKFPSVIFWANHMLNHEKQSLNFPNTEINRNEVEFNTNISTNSESMELEILPHQRLYTKSTHTLAGSVKEELEDHNLVRETEYFVIRKLPKYLCKICQKYASLDLHSLAIHMISHRECSLHECVVCDIKFPNVISWTNHMLNHEEQNPNLPNSEISCNEVELNTNISTNSESMEPQVLSYQNIPSKSTHTLTNQTHVDSRTFRRKHCDTTFSSRGSYTNHENSQILKENNLKELNEMVNTKLQPRVSNLNYRIDDNRKKYVNKTLHTEFNTNPSVSAKKNLNNSVGVITDNTSELNCCKICYKQCENRKSLTLHMHIHSKLKCQCCHITFNGEAPYNDHLMKFHNNFTIVIENINGANLKRHQHEKNHNNSELVNTNLNQKKKFWFPCDACEKKYSTPDQLIIHRKIHCVIGPYLCKICKKSYNARYMWNRHLKSHYRKNKLKNKYNRLPCTSKSETSKIKNKTIHQNKRIQFVCYICKNTFWSMETYNIHIKKFHKRLNIADLVTSANANANVNNKETKTVNKNQNY